MFNMNRRPKSKGTANGEKAVPRACRPFSPVGGMGPSGRTRSVRRGAAARQVLRRHESGVTRQHLGDLLLILQELGGGLEDFRRAALLATAQPGVRGLLAGRSEE